MFLLLLIPININAENKIINVHVFYKDGCSHCDSAKEFVKSYITVNDNIKVYTYNIKEKEVNDLFISVTKVLNKKVNGVPFIVIGSESVVGFDKSTTTGKNIENIIEYYQTNEYIDVVTNILNNNDIEVPSTTINQNEIYIPIIGKINPKEISLPLLAIIIGLVDGFNPCAMWILIFLISMLMGMKDQTKMWTLGLTFIITSGLVYFFFMVGWLELATYLNTITFFKILISIIAIIFGIFNIYSYFKEQKEDIGCDVVDNKKRKKITNNIKNILANNSLLISLIGIALLAVAVNILELLCSLGLPVLYTNILAINNVTGFIKYIYIFIYIIFFMLDDIVIFLIAMKTLKITAISNKYTKYSHLIGGVIMIVIGLLMLLKPEWLMLNFN
jgi:glutaredoxin